jgi:hypothetical protein
MVSINRLGGTLEQQSPSVTLPRYILPEIDIEREPQEAAARIAERKVIRAGVDAWQAIGKAESFENWKAVGNALAIGKAHALRVTGANAPWGRNYSRVFCDWMCEYRFESDAQISALGRDRAPRKHRRHYHLARDAQRAGPAPACASIIECAPLAGGNGARRSEMPDRSEKRRKGSVA